jgi:predicted NBD/HSP70 family sugar kinase
MTAKNLLDNECRRFSEALFRLSILFDPDLLVIAGDITAAGKPMENTINKMLNDKFSGIPRTSPKFCFSNLENNNPVALGAAFLSIGKLTDSLIENNCVSRAESLLS